MNTTNDTIREIGQNLRRIREQKRISQKELALSMDMAPAQYGRLENGKATPSILTLMRVAKALNVGLDLIVYGKKIAVAENLKDKDLIDKMNIISSLPPEEKFIAYEVIDLVIARKKLKDIVKNVHTLHR